MFGKISKKITQELKTKNKSSPKNDTDEIQKVSDEIILETQNVNLTEKSTSSESESNSKSQKNSINSDTIFGQLDSQNSQKNMVNPEDSEDGDKSQILLLAIEDLSDKIIKPVIDFNKNCLYYPILSKIGKASDDVSYLDSLEDERILKKEIFEKLIVCPIHHDTFASSVKLYCPKCNSVDVEKLNLFEHKKCGFITENSEFDFSNPKNSKCPNCKKVIEDYKKEIRTPAMWYQCLNCKDKFDNAIIKMYCRKYLHDFDINSGQFVTTYSYKLRDYDAPITSDDKTMREDLTSLLDKFNFSTEFQVSVKGKSGNRHKVPIFAKNNSTQETFAVFLDRDSKTVSQSSINSILVPILDIGPKHTLLLSPLEVEKDVESIAKQYGIKIIGNLDLSKISDHMEDFISEHYSKNGEIVEQ